MKKKKSPLILKPGALPLTLPILPGPMFNRAEAGNVTFTVSGDKLHIQAPTDTIKKIADRLVLLGAKAEAPSPYGPWSEKKEGVVR